MAVTSGLVLMTALLLKFSHNAPYLLTFECQVTAGHSTVWTGTAFMCANSNNEIVLLYNRIKNETTEANGTCNNGSIVGEIIDVNGNNYTSQLNITFSSSLIGNTVICERDDGIGTSLVENYTITIMKDNNHSTTAQQPDTALAGSISLSLEIIIATISVCLTLCLIGVVLITVLVCIAKSKRKKPKSKELKTEQTPVDNNCSQNLMVEEPSPPEPIFHCVPPKTVTGPDGYSLCVLNNVKEESVIVTNSNYSYLEDPEDSQNLEQELDMKSDGVNRRSGCVRAEDESLDLDSLLMKLHGRIDTQWYALGTAIGIPIEFLNSLKCYPEQECMVEMLDYWLRHHPDQPTWKEIADAIEDIHDYNLARSIKGVYDLPTSLMGIGDHDSIRV